MDIADVLADDFDIYGKQLNPYFAVIIRIMLNPVYFLFINLIS